MKKGPIIIIVVVLIAILGGSGYYFVSSNNKQKAEEMQNFQEEVNLKVKQINMLIMDKNDTDKYNEFIDISKNIIQNEEIDKKELLLKELSEFYNKVSKENKEKLDKELNNIKKIDLSNVSNKNKEEINELIKNIEAKITEANYIEAKKLIEKAASQIKYAKENKSNEDVRNVLTNAEKYLDKGEVNKAEGELNKVEYDKLNHENKSLFNDLKEEVDNLKELLGISGTYKLIQLSDKGAEKYKIELEIKTDKNGNLSLKGKEEYVSEIKSEEGDIILVDDLEKEMLEDGRAIIKKFDVTGELKIVGGDKSNEDYSLFEGEIKKTGEEKKKTMLKYNGNNIEINFYGKKLVLER